MLTPGLAAGCAKPFGTEAVDDEEKFTSSCYVGNFLGHIGRDDHDNDIVEVRVMMMKIMMDPKSEVL